MPDDGDRIHFDRMTELKPNVSPLLVGRDDVLELIERRSAEAAAGRGQFLLLAGEAGIGKSRLVAALRTAALARGSRVMQADIAPQDRDLPAALFLDLARTAAGTPPFKTLGADLLALREAARTPSMPAAACWSETRRTASGAPWMRRR